MTAKQKTGQFNKQQKTPAKTDRIQQTAHRMSASAQRTYVRNHTCPVVIPDSLASLDSLEQAVDQAFRGVFVHGMRPIRMDKYHVDVHDFEPLFKLDAHDGGVGRVLR